MSGSLRLRGLGGVIGRIDPPEFQGSNSVLVEHGLALACVEMRNIFWRVDIVADRQCLLLGRIVILAYAEQPGSLENDRCPVSRVTVGLGARPIRALDEHGIGLSRGFGISAQHGHFNAWVGGAPFFVTVGLILKIRTYGR